LVLGAVIFGAGTIASFAQTMGANLQRVCPMPAVGLRQGAPNTNTEIAPFSFDGRTFQMEIASAFAPRHINGNSSFCLRYEAENITAPSTPAGQERIDRFYWPMAEMSVERFQVGQSFRQSVMQTTPSAKPPALASTDLYAFKRSHFSSTAYKVSILNQKPAGDVVRVSLGDNQVTSPKAKLPAEEQRYAQLVGLPFEGAPHPIGAVWQAANVLVTATTDLNPSRTFDAITISIERSDNKNVGFIFAPFAQALALAKEPKQLPGLIEELRQKAIVMDKDVAHFGNNISINLQSPETRLFVVKQPIVFFGPGGSRVCFLAPTYSPVPIEPSLLTCDPEQVFPPR